MADYARGWLGTRAGGKDRSAARVRSLFENHVFDVPLGRMRMVDVRFSNVEGWLTSRQAVLAPRTVRGLLGYVKRMFAAAVKDHAVDESPCYDLKAARVPNEPKEALSEEELEAVRLCLPLAWRDIVVVGAKSGMRPSELRGLCVDQVDRFRRAIRVDRQLQPEGFVPPKYESFRTTFVGQECIDVIDAHVARWGQGADGLVFTNGAGRPLSYDALNSGWQRAVAKAQARHSTPHALRHHYASVLSERGVDIANVADQLGHIHAGITSSVYTHIVKGREEQRREVIEAALEKKCAPVVPWRASKRSQKGR